MVSPWFCNKQSFPVSFLCSESSTSAALLALFENIPNVENIRKFSELFCKSKTIPNFENHSEVSESLRNFRNHYEISDFFFFLHMAGHSRNVHLLVLKRLSKNAGSLS